MPDVRAFLRRAVLVLTAALCGCAFQSERIVLLPSQDEHPAAVVVKQGDRQVLLDRPYAATDLGVADPWPYRASEAEIRAGFGDALAAQPSRSASFTLYFVEGSDELTDDSKRTLENVFADLKQRAVPDVLVVGHTDAVGTNPFNDELARKRADTVKAMLMGRGVRADDIVAIGRGKRELLVPTADGVAEPRNRRVEIVVR
jgi:OmpA-OmpF porin, OOP family